MKTLTRAMIGVAVLMWFGAQAHATTSSILIDSTIEETIDLTATFGHPLPVGSGGVPELTNIDRIFRGTPGTVFRDTFFFTVDALTDGTAALLAFNVPGLLGLKNIRLTVFETGPLTPLAITFTSGPTPISVALFDLDPALTYAARVRATLTQSIGRYDLTIALAAAPLPAALVLFGTALAALFGWAGIGRARRAA